MAYDQNVIAAINAELDAANAPPMVRKAAFEAGIVESGLRNLNYGDRDSLGAFQQRPSQGWGTPQQITNPRYAARQFVSHAINAYQSGKYKTAGQLAQAVQRSAYPGRYDAVGNQAAALLGGGGGASSPSQPGSTSSAGGVSSTAPSAPELGGQGSDFTGLLASLLGQQQSQQPQMTPLAPPAFAASALTPKGFHPLDPAAVPQGSGQDPLSANLSLVQALQGPDMGQQTPGTSTAPQAAPESSGGGIVASVQQQRAAGIRISPHARPGDPVVSSQQSEGGLHETAGLAGYPAHDYFAPAGTHAVAPVSGKVIKLSGHDPMVGPTQGPHGPFGYSVYIQGQDGKTYFLTHLGSRNVKPGQTVQQGQIIGTVGDYDKYGTPSHIHQGVNGS